MGRDDDMKCNRAAAGGTEVWRGIKIATLSTQPLQHRTIGIVLAGGSSTRLKRDGQPVPGGKIWLQVAGRSLVESVCARLMGELGEVIVVAGPGQALPPLPAGVEVIADTRPGSGPLAGLADGLRAAASSTPSGGLPPPRQALVVSADLPLISPAVIRLLCGALAGGKPHSAGEPQQRAPLWAVPLVAGHLQVLLSAVDLRIVTDVEAYLASGRRDPRGLLESLQIRAAHLVRLLPEAELRGVDPQLESFRDIDTWEDFLAAGGQMDPGTS